MGRLSGSPEGGSASLVPLVALALELAASITASREEWLHHMQEPVAWVLCG